MPQKKELSILFIGNSHSMADSLMDRISAFMEEICEAEITDEQREII